MTFKWKQGRPERAFVTGAASGLGQAFCTHLLAEGVSVAGFDLAFSDASEGALRQAAKPGQKLALYPLDVADNASVQAAFARAFDEIGVPDLLINAAGINQVMPFHEMPEEAFSRLIDINLKGTRNVVAAALPRMQSGGQIALVGSLGGKTANYGYAGYSASKFGVVGLTEVLRLELIERDIDVSSVCPAEIQTPMVEEEHRVANPISLRLKKFAGAMPLDRGARMIMAGIAARRAVITPGFRASLTLFLSGASPALTRLVSGQMVRDELRRKS